MLRATSYLMLVTLIFSWLGIALAAGVFSDPPISAKSINTTGTWTCHLEDSNDKVEMTASANDYDECPWSSGGNRIDLASTTWEIDEGTLDSATGATNAWKAGSTTGQYTLTVTFKDLDDGADLDDDDSEKQQTLIAFKVGV